MKQLRHLKDFYDESDSKTIGELRDRCAWLRRIALITPSTEEPNPMLWRAIGLLWEYMTTLKPFAVIPQHPEDSARTRRTALDAIGSVIS